MALGGMNRRRSGQEDRLDMMERRRDDKVDKEDGGGVMLLCWTIKRVQSRKKRAEEVEKYKHGGKSLVHTEEESLEEAHIL